MRGLFRRLNPPWSLPEQLNYAYRNLLPRFRVAIHREDFANFGALELYARRVEKNYEAASQYRPPPLPEHSVCPDLAYRPPPRSQRPHTTIAATDVTAPEVEVNSAPVKEAYDRTPKTNAKNNPPRNSETRAKNVPSTSTAGIAPQTAAGPICWNYGGNGHLSRNCEEPPQIHCYRCGKGSTIRECPKCSGNEGKGS